MIANKEWKALGWQHGMWDLLRFYRSIRGEKKKQEWIDKLKYSSELQVGEEESLPIPPEQIQLLLKYLADAPKQFAKVFDSLRTEEEAKAHCAVLGSEFGITVTQSGDHHQSSKSLVAGVSHIAKAVTKRHGTTVEGNPQKRCVWCNSKGLHVTARNLDGAIPSLANPSIIWEIKEYWGKTKGGSKMSDAVYECHLVGRELLDFKEKTGVKVEHIVFVDGKEQWGYRQSDLARFIDITNQGLIDHLFVGKDVENQWEIVLEAHLR